MENIISSPPLRVSVGPKKREFFVHAAAIASQSEPLHDLIRSDAAKSNQLVLDGVEEQTFVLFSEYVYTGDYNLKIGASSPVVPDVLPQANGTGTLQSEKEKKKKKKKQKKAGGAAEAEQSGPGPTGAQDEKNGSTGAVGPESPATPAPVEYAPYSQTNGKHHGESPIEQEEKSIISDLPEQEPNPESVILSPSPSVGRESLWSEFKNKSYLNKDLPPTSPPYKPTECRTHGQILLLHAKVYLLAENYTVAKLVSVSLDKLHQALVEFEVRDDTVEDIVQLFRFSFEKESPDLLRSLLSLFAECHVEELWKNQSFRDLVAEYGYLSKRLIGSLVSRVNLG